MSTSLSLPVSEYYVAVYRHDKHALPKQEGTRKQFHAALANFDKAFRFMLAEKGERIRSPQLIDLSDELVKYAMAWQIGRGRSAATANQLYRTICAIWRHAYAAGILASLPRTKKYGEPKREPRAWSIDECARLMAAAEHAPGWLPRSHVLAREFFAAYCWFTYASGARRGVTLALPTSCFDLERGEVLLPADLQKQNADQTIELLPEAVEAVARLGSAERGLERLFGDWTASATHFNKRLRRIIVAAGLRKTVTDVTRRDLSHKLRKSFATHVAANSDEETARRLLGHSHISVTRMYLDPRFLKHASARDLVPPLRPRDETPPPDPDGPQTLRLHRPEAEPDPRASA